MEILYTTCAGLDVHKKMVKVCVMTHLPNGQRQKEFRTYLTTTEELLKLGDWLKERGCTHIAFEATGVYTPPPILPKRCRSGSMESRSCIVTFVHV